MIRRFLGACALFVLISLGAPRVDAGETMHDAGRKLADWVWTVRPELVKLADPPWTRLSLFHVRDNGSTGDMLGAFDFPAEPGKAQLSEAIARIVAVATDAAQGSAAQGGVMTFAVYPYQGDAKRAFGRCTFDLQTSSDPRGLVGPEIGNEPATDRGMAARAQRHTEVLMRTTVYAQAAAVNALERALDHSTRLADKYAGKFLEYIEATETLKSSASERELAAQEQHFKLSAKAKILERLMPALGEFAEAVMTKAKTKLLGSGKADVGIDDWEKMTLEQQVAAFCGALTREEIGRVIDQLEPKKVNMLVSIYGRVREGEKSRAAAAEEVS